MATYTPGSKDYIPQLQPFKPDYNFLGNLLERKQSQYDQNYKALSQTYGKLLNSEMLRDDTNAKRDEFFKVIDNDIKRISQMDLSLQQNVDAANSVFSSFYDNKDMYKDMVFTKNYKDQLNLAESYRNCIDPDECGGAYWEEGVSALHYRADEFKKASKEQMMNMSAGHYTPYINIQEESLKLVKEYFGPNSILKGPSDVVPDATGRYRITLKNGQLLEIPLQQLLYNTFSNDPRIQDMYKTKAYVDRKNFIASNVEQYGNEDAAEDAYFNIVDSQMQDLQKAYSQNEQLRQDNNIKKTALEQNIKKNGTTGEDKLAIDYAAAGIDEQVINETGLLLESNNKIVNSIYSGNLSREAKRRAVDSVMTQVMMGQAISNSGTAIAALTGSSEWEVDEYAKSMFDHQLKMSEIQYQDQLTGEREKRNKILDYLLGDGEEGGGDLFGPTYDLFGGTVGGDIYTAGGTVKQSEDKQLSWAGEKEQKKEFAERIMQAKDFADPSGFGKNYVESLADDLMSQAGNKFISGAEGTKTDNASSEEAMQILEKIFGKYDPNVKGSEGYDRRSNKLVGGGKTYSSMSEVTGDSNPIAQARINSEWSKYFNRSQQIVKKDGIFDQNNSNMLGKWYNQKGEQIEKDYNVKLEKLTAQETALKQNLGMVSGLIKADKGSSIYYKDGTIREVSDYTVGEGVITNRLEFFDFMKNEKDLISSKADFVNKYMDVYLSEKQKQDLKNTGYIETRDYNFYTNKELRELGEEMYDDFYEEIKNTLVEKSSSLKNPYMIELPGIGGTGGVTSSYIFQQQGKTNQVTGVTVNTKEYVDLLNAGLANIYIPPNIYIKKEKLQSVANMLLTDIMTSNKKDNYLITTDYLPTHISGQNNHAFRIRINDEAFFKKHHGTAEDPSIVDDLKDYIQQNGIVITTNQETHLVRATQEGDRGFIMSYNESKLGNEYGNFTISKRNPVDGTYTYNGNYQKPVLDNNNNPIWEDGKLLTEWVNIPNEVVNVGGEEIYDFIDNVLKVNAMTMKSLINKQKKRYYDPKLLLQQQNPQRQQGNMSFGNLGKQIAEIDQALSQYGL